jgi:nitrosocyanin
MRNLFALSALLAVIAAPGVVRAGETREVTIVNIEYEGSKVWIPGTIVAKKGDTLKIKLINNVKSDPNTHGFAIGAFNVAEVVTRGETKAVEVKVDKAGIFPITCQLHPAHVGGQLVVLE